MPVPTPRRAERAQLTHSVRHPTGSLKGLTPLIRRSRNDRRRHGQNAPPPARLSTAVSCTCWRNSGFPPAFPISGSVQVTPRFPPAGPDGHGSPPSAVLSGRYDFLPSHVLRLIGFASRLRGCLPSSCPPRALPPPCRPGNGPGSGLFSLAVPFPASLPTGKSRISQVPWRSIP